jgi:large subunit ribosomal protein L23
MRLVLKRPLLSEKSMSKNDQGTYVFEVSTDANKIEIRKAVEERYKVGVTSVRTITIRPKAKMRMTRRGYIVGKTPQRKKAIVTVRAGQTIDIVGDLPND